MNNVNFSSLYKKNLNLEALRGYAAIFVVIGHAINAGGLLDSNYFADKKNLYVNAGHVSVLIFFILSGYVIGLNNKEPINTRLYLKKRFIRLYPIFVISILFAIMVSNWNYSVITVINNLIFTPLFFNSFIKENIPAWSLNYEVIYYLLFIPISILKLRASYIILFSFLIGLGNFLLYPTWQFPLLTSCCFGFIFWMAGLWLSQNSNKQNNDSNFHLMVSNLFLILSLSSLNILNLVIVKLEMLLLNKLIAFPNTLPWTDQAITFSNFSYLPYGLMFIFVFTGKQIRGSKQIITILQLLPSLYFLYLFNKPDQFDPLNHILPITFYCLSLIFYFCEFPFTLVFAEKIIKLGVWIGSISYGLYIIHYPILSLFPFIEIFTGSFTTYIIRFIVYLTLSIFAGWILDKIIQPRIAKFLNKN